MDEEELENPRSHQAELDRIAFDIENLFLRFETVIPSESNLCEATRDFIPEISSLCSGISDQISYEQKRRGALGQELAGVRSSKENIDKQVAKLNEIEVVPVFPRKKYINTFHHFRKGNLTKVLFHLKNLRN